MTTHLVGFARTAKAAPAKGEGVVAAVVNAIGGAAGQGNCGTGSANGKRGFQKGNQCGKGKRNEAVAAASKAHRSASAAVRRHAKAGTAGSKEGRAALTAAAKAHRELESARATHRANKAAERNTRRREARASAKASAADPRNRAAARLDSAKAQASPPAVAERVAKSAKEASAIKGERARQHLDDLGRSAADGSRDGDALATRVEQIARGATKDELFAAAKAAGFDAGDAKTKVDLVNRLKGQAFDRFQAGRDAREKAAAPKGEPTDRRLQAEILQAARNPGRYGVKTEADGELVTISGVRDALDRKLGRVDEARFNAAVVELRARRKLGTMAVSDRRLLTGRELDRSIPGVNETLAYFDRVRGRTTDKGLARRYRGTQ